MHLDSLDRMLVNRYQGGLPVDSRPFAKPAAEAGLSEKKVISRIGNLKERSYLTRVGPLYDAARLGGAFTLAAMTVPEAVFDSVADQVNSFSEVAHNYRRDHLLNMWFVVATPTPQGIDSTLLAIEEATGLKVFNFPKQKEFYIGLWLNINPNGIIRTLPVPETDPINLNAYTLDDLDMQIIRQTQAGLPLCTTPYQTLAEACSCPEKEILARIRNFLDRGIIRRIGLVPNHMKLGLKANGMTVWDVSDSSAMTQGEIIGKLDFVSHCYLRPRHLPQWRYNLFAMIHGHDRDEVGQKIEEIKTILGKDLNDHDVLFSTAILKKAGFRLVA